MFAYYDILSAKFCNYSVIIDVLISLRYCEPTGSFFINYSFVNYEAEVGNYSYN